MTTAAQRTLHQSARSDKRLVNDKPIALRLEKAELSEAHAAAESQGRSSSNFARLIYLMGMSVYRETGRIELPARAVQNSTASAAQA